MLINLKEKNNARGQLLSELTEQLQHCNFQTVAPARLLFTFYLAGASGVL